VLLSTVHKISENTCVIRVTAVGIIAVYYSCLLICCGQSWKPVAEDKINILTAAILNFDLSHPGNSTMPDQNHGRWDYICRHLTNPVIL